MNKLREIKDWILVCLTVLYFIYLDIAYKEQTGYVDITECTGFTKYNLQCTYRNICTGESLRQD